MKRFSAASMLVLAAVLAVYAPLSESAALTFPNNHVSVWIASNHRWVGTADTSGLSRVTAHDEVYACGATNNHLDDHYHDASSAVYDAYIRKMDATTSSHHWTRFYDTPKTTVFRGCDADADGTVYAMGYTYSHIASAPVSTNPELFIAAFDRYGNELWKRQYHSEHRPHTSYLINFPLVYDDATNTLVGAYTLQSPHCVVIVKFDPSNGDMLWQSNPRLCSVTGSVYIDQEASRSSSALVVDSTGSILVGAISAYDFDATYGWGPSYNHTREGTSYEDIVIAKYTANGVPIWRHFLASSSDEGVRGLAVDEYDNVLAVGYTAGIFVGEQMDHGASLDAFVAKLDGDTGSRIWVRLIDFYGSDERAHAVAVDTEGFVFVSLRRPNNYVDVYMLDADGLVLSSISQSNPREMTDVGLSLTPGGDLVTLVTFNDGLDVYDTYDRYSWQGGVIKVSVDRNCSCDEVGDALSEALALVDAISA